MKRHRGLAFLLLSPLLGLWSLEIRKAKGVYLVPTLSVIDAEFAKDPATREDPTAKNFLEDMQQAVRQAKELGVKIADGPDAARAELHARNADELIAMTKRGLTSIEAIFVPF